METKDLNNWCEFEQELVKLESEYNNLRRQRNFDVSPWLFRGQANVCWKLESTLERFLKKEEIPAKDYLEIVDQVRPQIETYTGKTWNINFSEFNDWKKGVSWYFFKSFPIPYLEYLIYLRHHGFPSPVLDWTKSPFIAAYFAFSKIPDRAGRVAIYAYMESEGVGKTLDSDNPVISSLPSNVPSHKRHFVQQSAYTACVKKTKSGLIIFTSHEKAFPQSPKAENRLCKFTLPSSERIKVLKKLDQMNINCLSLFDSEESLMETLALRVFCLANNDL
jgi:hypothetical protein